MQRPYRRPVQRSALVLGALLAIGAAACGGGTSSTAPAGSPAPVGTAARGTFSAIDFSGKLACELLSADDFKEIAGLTLTATNAAPADTVYANVCRFTFADNPGSVDIGVMRDGAAAFFDRTVEFEGGTPIEGLGDRAIRTKISDSVMTLKGDSLVDVFVLGTGTSDEVEEQLAKRALENDAR